MSEDVSRAMSPDGVSSSAFAFFGSALANIGLLGWLHMRVNAVERRRIEGDEKLWTAHGATQMDLRAMEREVSAKFTSLIERIGSLNSNVATREDLRLLKQEIVQAMQQTMGPGSANHTSRR